jgi:phosphatidylserine/phosphatidylglycerophosphate/cardiolipin synthase-like enzyme
VAAVSLKQQRYQVDSLNYRIYQFKSKPADIREFAPRYEELASSGESPGDEKTGPRYGIHAKSLVIDGKIAIVCTSNLDPRSAYLNTECALILHDEALALDLENEIRRDMAPQNSWTVAKRKRIPLLGDLNNLLAFASEALPILDIWPVLNTTCYELRDGKHPLPTDHPEFYRRYQAVGNFPECENTNIPIQTLVFKSTLGWATPIM